MRIMCMMRRAAKQCPWYRQLWVMCTTHAVQLLSRQVWMHPHCERCLGMSAQHSHKIVQLQYKTLLHHTARHHSHPLSTCWHPHGIIVSNLRRLNQYLSRGALILIIRSAVVASCTSNSRLQSTYASELVLSDHTIQGSFGNRWN